MVLCRWMGDEVDPTEANLINNVDVIEEELRSVLLLYYMAFHSPWLFLLLLRR